jgi:hypothetical protein
VTEVRQDELVEQTRTRLFHGTLLRFDWELNIMRRHWLGRQGPPGHEARRFAGDAAHQVRASDQPQNRQGAWPRSTADAACPRR